MSSKIRKRAWLAMPLVDHNHIFASLCAVRDADAAPMSARCCTACGLLQVETSSRSGNRSWVSVEFGHIALALNEKIERGHF